MIEQICEREAGLVARCFEPIMKLLAKRDMKRAIDEVIGILDADLAARLREVALRGRCRAQGVPRRGRGRGADATALRVPVRRALRRRGRPE